MDKKEPEHLGMGVYAEFDGFHVTLTTLVSSVDEVKPDSTIYLDEKTATEVVKYLKWAFEIEW